MTENKPKDIRYTEIIGAAVKCFAEKGRHNTTIDDIASTANLTKGGVYWHFKDKREIYLAMIDQHLQEDMKFWEESITREGTGPDSIAKTGIAYIRYSMQNKNHLYLHAEMLAESFRDEVLKKKLDGLHTKWRAMICDFFEMLLKKMGKEVAADEIETISCILLSCIEGLAHQCWFRNENADLGYYENVWTTFSRLLLKGLDR
ncbi:MAG: TetR/AcrR family transcriptional regulator [Spirochaetes bacterium]|nr:TetR/AcrR family transcriptional regulator [Spirochaetota bacterium]